MFIYVVLLVALVAHANCQQNCDLKGTHFYDQLNCTAGDKGPDSCPLSYKCPKYEVPNGKCRFYSDILDDGEVAAGSYCNRGCTCDAQPEKKGHFNCGLVIDCRFNQLKPGCYWARKDLRECCPEMICPPFKSNFTCKVGNEVFRDGEFFSPKNTCFNCICREGFTGKLEEPSCIRRPCDMDLRNADKLEKQCAPVYRPTKENPALCCPFNFICREDLKNSEVIEKGEESKDKCEFAGQQYNIGDKLKVLYLQRVSYEFKANCECRVGPYMSCVSA